MVEPGMTCCMDKTVMMSSMEKKGKTSCMGETGMTFCQEEQETIH